jgi:hypothetical protein
VNETLFDARGLDETRIRRAFGWLVTFRDFPVGSRQTVDGDSMMTEALTLFTKGRAEFYLNGTKRGDRLPGILSSEHDLVGQGGTFELRYVEPTTRICIPSGYNRDRLPSVNKIVLQQDETFPVDGKYLVALGAISVADKTFAEERTFKTTEPRIAVALEPTILLQFLD